MRSDVGHLRQRITFYNTTRVDDGAGGFTRSDPSGATEIGTFWAKIEPASTREITRAQQHEESISHKVLVRYNAAFTDGQTIKHRGNFMYVVTVVDPTHKKEWLHLMVREGGPQ